MKKKSALVVAVVGVALVAGGYQYLTRSSQNAVSDNAQSQSAEAVAAKAPEMRPADVLKRQSKPTPEQLKANYEKFMANRPAYLADVDLPGEYAVDENGNLIVNESMKDLLDYFMLGIGDIPFDQLHDLIAGNMYKSLQEPALSQALQVLDNYFAYIDSYDQWEKSFDKEQMLTKNPVDMKAALQQLEDMRRQHLGDTAYEAFFAEVAQTNSAYLDARIAMQQDGLTEEDKAAIREQLEQALPESVRVAQQQAMVQVNLAEQTQQLVKSGASEQEIYQARVASVGEEAASRLQTMDAEDRAWEQKRQQYKSLLSSTPGADGLSDEEKSQYVADLAQKELGLSVNEVKRMQALDRIESAETVQ
ncbi:MAG TPA: lipase secretion chaperone [Dongiaceae bacterium]|nr:lipase secretion chaperone [Dongiaceae bacterium]